MTQTVKADPSQRRQLADSGPLLFWRDGADSRREGLVLVAGGCRDPECDCREVTLEAKRVSDRLLKIDFDRRFVDLHFRDADGEPERLAFVASVDVDTGKLETVEEAGEPDVDALAWLRAEVDDELLATLRAQREALKNSLSPDDWKEVDWSRWSPGARICWEDVNPGLEVGRVMLGERLFLYNEFFATDADDIPDMVQIFFDEALDEDGEMALEHLGCVEVIPEKLGLALKHAEPGQEELLDAVWARYCERGDVGARLITRRARVLEIGGELNRLHAEQHAPVRKGAKVAPNDKCTCGSGKKYKRCCGRG